MAERDIVIYDNCEVLPIYNFMKIINTDDLTWLVKDNEQTDEDLTTTWDNIIAEYLDLKKDKRVLQSYDARIVIERLEAVYLTCTKLIGLCTLDIGLENIEKISNALEKHNKKYRIDLSKPLEEEKKRILKLFKKLKFSIDLKKSNFEQEFSAKEEFTKIDIYKEMASLEQSLKRNEIDPKKTVVAKWIALCNIAKNGG